MQADDIHFFHEFPFAAVYRGGNIVEGPIVPHRPNASGHQDDDLYVEGNI